MARRQRLMPDILSNPAEVHSEDSAKGATMVRLSAKGLVQTSDNQNRDRCLAIAREPVTVRIRKSVRPFSKPCGASRVGAGLQGVSPERRWTSKWLAYIPTTHNEVFRDVARSVVTILRAKSGRFPLSIRNIYTCYHISIYPLNSCKDLCKAVI